MKIPDGINIGIWVETTDDTQFSNNTNYIQKAAN